MKSKAETIDEYLADVDRSVARARTAPRACQADSAGRGGHDDLRDADPSVPWAPLVYLTASKKHMSFYPSSWAIEELSDRLAGYKTTQHAIQFTLQAPLPDELIEELVLVHKRVIDAATPR